MDSTLGRADFINEPNRTWRLDGFFLERDCCKKQRICDHTRKKRVLSSKSPLKKKRELELQSAKKEEIEVHDL